jgi:hypothetical protein
MHISGVQQWLWYWNCFLNNCSMLFSVLVIDVLTHKCFYKLRQPFRSESEAAWCNIWTRRNIREQTCLCYVKETKGRSLCDILVVRTVFTIGICWCKQWNTKGNFQQLNCVPTHNRNVIRDTVTWRHKVGRPDELQSVMIWLFQTLNHWKEVFIDKHYVKYVGDKLSWHISCYLMRP